MSASAININLLLDADEGSDCGILMGDDADTHESRFEVISEEPLVSPLANAVSQTSPQPNVQTSSAKEPQVQIPRAPEPKISNFCKMIQQSYDSLSLDIISQSNMFQKISAILPSANKQLITKYLSVVHHLLFYELKTRNIRMIIRTSGIIKHLNMRLGVISDSKPTIDYFAKKAGVQMTGERRAVSASHSHIFAELIPCLIFKTDVNMESAIMAVTKNITDTNELFPYFFIMNVLYYLIRGEPNIVFVLKNSVIKAKKYATLSARMQKAINCCWERPNPLAQIANEPESVIVAGVAAWTLRVMNLAAAAEVKRGENSGEKPVAMPNIVKMIEDFSRLGLANYEYIVFVMVGAKYLKATSSQYFEQKIENLLAKLGPGEFY